MQVQLPRLCCIFMHTEPDAEPRSKPPTHIVLDIRSHAASAYDARPRPDTALVHVVQHMSSAPFAPSSGVITATLAVRHLTVYALRATPRQADSASAACVLSLQPRAGSADASGGSPIDAPPCALFVQATLNAEARRATRAIVGDPVAMAWAQAEAHRSRDWESGCASSDSLYSPGPSAAGGPAQGRLFPVQFSADDVHNVAHAGAAVSVTVRAPDARARFSLEDIPGYSRLSEGCVRLLRATATGDSPPSLRCAHVVATVTAGGAVVMTRGCETFDLRVSSADVLYGQGLAGVAGSAVALVVGRGIKLTTSCTDRDGDSAQTHLLYHISHESTTSRLEIVSACKPRAEQLAVGALRTETVTSHLMRGVTFGAPHGDVQLSWIGELSSALRAALPPPTAPSAVVVSSSTTHLLLEDAAMAYMPPAPPGRQSSRRGAAERGTAMVAFVRGLHSCALGSVRHVNVADLRVAIGAVDPFGAAPWGVAAPRRGWDERVCEGLGLRVVLAEEALSVVVDPSATVDSVARREARASAAAQAAQPQGAAEQAPGARTDGVQLTNTGLHLPSEPLQPRGRDAAAQRDNADSSDLLLDYLKQRQTSAGGAAAGSGTQADELHAPPQNMLASSMYRSALSGSSAAWTVRGSSPGAERASAPGSAFATALPSTAEHDTRKVNHESHAAVASSRSGARAELRASASDWGDSSGWGNEWSELEAGDLGGTLFHDAARIDGPGQRRAV